MPKDSVPADSGLVPEHEHALRQQLGRIRDWMIENLFAAAGVFAALYTPVLLWRAWDIGWQLHLRTQAALVLVVLVVMPLRARLMVGFKSGLLLACFLALGSVGTTTGGMVGAGYWWLLQSAVLGAMFYSLRTGILLNLAGAALLVLVGVGFVNGWLVIPFELDAYRRSGSAWLSFLAVATLAPMVLLPAFSGYQDTIRSLVTEINAHRGELAAQVGHDPLTGLPQATLAADRLQVALQQADRSASKLALLFIDLDGFKGVNDGHGHAAGDHVLRQLALRLGARVRAHDTLGARVRAHDTLGARVRAHDTVARVGGDEFIVILTELRDAAGACRVAEQVIADTADIASWRQHRLLVGASVGIALYPDHAGDAASLRARADAAMYDAKRAGRNNWRLAKRAAAAQAG